MREEAEGAVAAQCGEFARIRVFSGYLFGSFRSFCSLAALFGAGTLEPVP